MKALTNKKSILFGLILLIINNCFSQPITKHYIDSSFKIKFASFKLNREVAYVVNGIPYDSIQLEARLNSFDVKHLIELQLIPPEKSGSQLLHNFYDAAIILIAFPQKKVAKRKAWKASKRLFSTDDSNPILLIDNVHVEPLESYHTFKGLHLKDIMYIDTTIKEGKNFIRIWKNPK